MDRSSVEVNRPSFSVIRQDSSSWPNGSYRYGPTVLNCDVHKSYSPWSVDEWRQRIRNGMNATTTLAISSTHVEDSPFLANYELVWPNHPFGYGPWSGSLSGSYAAFYGGQAARSISFDSVDNQAQMDFLRQVRNTQRTMSGGVFLGELGDVIHQITHPAMALRRGLNDYLGVLRKRLRPVTSDSVGYKISSKKRKFAIYRGSDYVWNSDYIISRVPLTARSLSRRDVIAKTVSDTWLEFSFGIRPLLSDIDGAARALGENAYRPPSKRVTGKSRRMARGDVTEGHIGMLDFADGVIGLNYQSQSTEELEVHYHGSVSIEHVDVAASASGLRQLGLGWPDVLPTVWELIPYSFLFDYFSNIGDIVEAMSVRQAAVQWKNRSYRWSQKVTMSGKNVDFHSQSWPQEHYSLSKPGQCAVESVELVREPWLFELSPSFSLRVPGVSTKWLNMAALLGARDSTRQRLRV